MLFRHGDAFDFPKNVRENLDFSKKNYLEEKLMCIKNIFFEERFLVGKFPVDTKRQIN